MARKTGLTTMVVVVAAGVAYFMQRKSDETGEPTPACGWSARALDPSVKAPAPEPFRHPAFPALEAETAAVMASRKAFAPDDLLTLWDGTKRTGPAHLDWMLGHVKDHVAERAQGFRNIGTSDGIDYDIHDELTAKGDGYGYFRLKGTVDVSPVEFVASVMNPLTIGAVDPTLRDMIFLHATPSYPDEHTWLAYWRAQPPAPFLWDLDGLDLTSYRRDANGTIWQISVSVPHELADAKTAVRAVDMYWGYKLEPINGGRSTRLTLVCQTALYNSIPKWLGNKFVCQVLADYVRSVERAARQWTASGKMDAFKSRCGLA